MKQTWLEISKSAFYHNIASIKEVTGNAAKLGFMLKADAYGHGLVPMAILAEHHPDIDYLFVASGRQALQLRALGLKKQICTLLSCDGNLEEVIARNIEITVYDQVYLEDLAHAAERVGVSARIHLKIDTGMSRLGLLPHEVFPFFEKLKNYRNIKVVGLMTHLCDADDNSSESVAFTQKQLYQFDEIIRTLPLHIVKTLEVMHACASIGTIFFQKKYSLVQAGESRYGCHLVRIATNIFGYYKPGAQRDRFYANNIAYDLRPIMSWKTRIIQLKKIPAGSYVGYNRTYCVQRPTVLAILPIGYFDGYSRALSNCGSVLVRGCYAPVIGRVSMNLCTIDVTDVPDIALYDEVILMGNYEGITADDLARKTGTINLAILTSIHQSIEKIIIEDTCLLSKATSVPENQLF